MRIPSSAAALALLGSAGCWWNTPANDDGDEAFAAAAVEAVLGRKPRGAAEVRALADLAGAAGREAVLEVLFEEPDYVTYWSNVFADALQVQRADGMAVDANCTAPALLPASLSDQLANHLATAPPDDPFCTWSGFTPIQTFEEATFWAAVDEAQGTYAGTLVDDLQFTAPMSQLPEPEKVAESVEPIAASEFADLEGQGSGPANRDWYRDDGDGFVAEIADLDRWRDLSGGAGGMECPPFNLTDVIEASVRADRLDAMYRAYLPVLATFPGSDVDAAMRNQLGAAFLDVYLDRDPTCMTCHTATYSKTDPRPRNAGWDRFYPVWYGLPFPLDAEGTVFSYDYYGTMLYGGDAAAIGCAIRSGTSSAATTTPPRG